MAAIGKTLQKPHGFFSAAIAVILLCCGGCLSQHKSKDVFNGCQWDSYVGSGTGIWVSIKDQELRLIHNRKIVHRYTCSTARAGIGSEQDSGKTPSGWHRIAAKIGDGLPTGAILKDRQWTGRIWPAGQETQDDLILSRILWLEGLEDSLNRGQGIDSRQRYIYIHGTNRVDELGRPASGGCVRLDPQAVIDLYSRVNEGTCVLITKD